jgi:prepilin-type N-terminal cleavage/methylation domain-containing protein
MTTKRNFGFTLIELMIVVAIIAIFATLITSVIKGGGFFNISNGTGEKIGHVIQLNHRGFMRNTWEAQLIRGGMTNGNGAFGVQPFNFTIEDAGLLKKVDQYRKENIEVNIKYRIEGVCNPMRSESKCTFLTGIEPVTKK